MFRIQSVAFVAILLSHLVLTPSAVAAGPVTNGALHTGTIQVGGIDTWTLSANANDRIAITIGTVRESGSDPEFVPWIRLRSPDGSTLSDRFGNNIAETDVRAPATGAYTILVAGRSQFQSGPGNYRLTVARTPGTYTISPGDEGGPMTNAVQHVGTIQVGDLDTWTFAALKNDAIAISIGLVPGTGHDPDFAPWIRLRGPDGATLGDRYGASVAEIDVRAPLNGIYTVLVAGRSEFQDGSGNYILTGSGLRPVTPLPAGILAVVGSTQGNGAFFRTSLQMHNPRATPVSGTLVFHRAGTSGSSNDPSLAYKLNGGQTIEYGDILPAMGISNGLGSLDIMTAGDPLPVMVTRIFSDGGPNGTAGFFIDPMTPDDALQTGESGVIIAPADPVKARLNLGIRSLEAGASLAITVRDRFGALRGTLTKTYAANFFEQVTAKDYLGLTLAASDTITFTLNSGKAIIYGAQTDNITQDPSAQFAKKTF
jgi:hypothetical protein